MYSRTFQNLVDVEGTGKVNSGFKNSTTTVDQISTITMKPQVEEEKVDEKTLAENQKRAAEGCIT